MLIGNQMSKALVNANIANPIKQKSHKNHKQFKCHRCGSDMVSVDNTNVMACTNSKCNNYFIFDK